MIAKGSDRCIAPNSHANGKGDKTEAEKSRKESKRKARIHKKGSHSFYSKAAAAGKEQTKGKVYGKSK